MFITKEFASSVPVRHAATFGHEGLLHFFFRKELIHVLLLLPSKKKMYYFYYYYIFRALGYKLIQIQK
jgi:hypothetical protein